MARLMSDAFLVLLTTALTLGFVHTAVGVDHVVPFVALAQARHWTLPQTLAMTGVCGLGHVLSSVLIAAIGLGLGVATSKLEWIEATRGSWAATLLIAFGLGYAAFAFWRSWRRRLGGAHGAGHDHHLEAAGLMSELGGDHKRLMPALFIIFVLGPCEALLPLLTASGLTLSLGQSLMVGAVFCGATLLTMLGLVAVGHWGMAAAGWSRKPGFLHTHAHALAGLSMALSGVAIQLLGI